MKDITFIEVMENLRSQSGFNVAHFCRQIGAKDPTYKNWRAGKHEPSNIVKSALLKKAQKLVRSLAVELPEDMEILSTEDAGRLFSDINDGIDGTRADVPFSVIIEALNRHCPPTQYIKIMDDIRGKYV